MRVVEFADAGSSGTAEPLGESGVARNSAHRSGGLVDIGLGPDLAGCSGIFILTHGNQLAADEERGLGGGEVAGAGVVGRDDRLAEQHRLGGAAAEALGAVQGYETIRQRHQRDRAGSGELLIDDQKLHSINPRDLTV